MALWNGLGQAATVAQLGGIDAAGLISMIVVAVQTVQRNKVECQLLANHVMLITDLLQLLEQSEMMRRPQIRRPLDGLEDTLCQAYMLVTSCQKSNVMFRFIMAGNLAQQFRDVRDRIDSYLRIYPLISHIDTRYFITELYSRTHPSGAEPQVSEEMLGSSGHLNPDSRTKGSTSSDNGVESVELQTETEPLALEVQQNDGYGNVEVFPNRKHRFRWLLQWNRAEASTQSIRRLIGHVETGSITIFKFSKLAASTNNFSSLNIIGTGGFGIVFKGVLPNGVDVAIKTYSSDSNQGLPEFQRELQIMPKLHHVNIVKLLGCCIEGGNRILVYEYICNGSLDRRIYGKDPTEGVPLSWPMRFRIIEGIAQGALYLNHHSRPHVIHRDLKPSNIVLGCDMTPKITDFGLALGISSEDDDVTENHVMGTKGYIAPECFFTGAVTIKCDVYAFGATLLTIITARRPYRASNTEHKTSYLAPYAWESWSSGRIMELIDPLLHDEPQMSQIHRCMQIALLCVQENPDDRPTMSDVIMMLKCENMTLHVPRSPGTFSSLASGNETSGSNTYSSAEEFMAEEEESLSYFSCRSSDVDDNDTSIVALSRKI